MTTLYILLGSGIAISLLVALNVWLGGWSPSRIGSLEVAIARLQDDHLVFTPGEGLLARDSLSALVLDTQSPRVGVVAARGAGFVTRLVPRDGFRTVEARDDGSLLLTFRGDTMRPVTVDTGNAQTAHDWAARIDGLEG